MSGKAHTSGSFRKQTRKVLEVIASLLTFLLAKTEQGQDEDRGIGIEKIVYLKPFKTFTRPFKQSKETNYKSSADVRLRILAMASGKLNAVFFLDFNLKLPCSGSWQIDETDQPVINPGANVSLLPDAIIIHDVLHDLILYEPLHDESNSGRLLLRFQISSFLDLCFNKREGSKFEPD